MYGGTGSHMCALRVEVKGCESKGKQFPQDKELSDPYLHAGSSALFLFFILGF